MALLYRVLPYRVFALAIYERSGHCCPVTDRSNVSYFFSFLSKGALEKSTNFSLVAKKSLDFRRPLHYGADATHSIPRASSGINNFSFGNLRKMSGWRRFVWVSHTWTPALWSFLASQSKTPFFSSGFYDGYYDTPVMSNFTSNIIYYYWNTFI